MTLHFDNATQATAWAITHLKAHGLDRLRNEGIELLLSEGFSIMRPDERCEWLSPEEVRERFAPHLSTGGFWKRMNHRRAPLYARDCAPSGKLVKLLPTPELIAWLSRPLEPGKRHDLVAA